MATTSGNLTAGTATIGGSRRNATGGRFGLRARVAAGVTTLGCAAALAVGIGGLGAGDTIPRQPQLAPAAPVIQASAMSNYEQRRFLEQNELPTGASTPTMITYEQRRFLEQNELPTDTLSVSIAPAAPTEFRGNGYTER